TAKTTATSIPAQPVPTESQPQPMPNSAVAAARRTSVVNAPLSSPTSPRPKPKEREAPFQNVVVHIAIPPANKPQLNTNQKPGESALSMPQPKLAAEQSRITSQPPSTAANHATVPSQKETATVVPAAANTPASSLLAGPISAPRAPIGPVQAQ